MNDRKTAGNPCPHCGGPTVIWFTRFRPFEGMDVTFVCWATDAVMTWTNPCTLTVDLETFKP